jgi:hypothetical protein
MQLKLNAVRLAFPSVYEAKAIKAGDDPAYSATFIFGHDHEAAKAVEAAIEQVATEKWGTKTKDILKAIRTKGDVCLHNGDEKAQYDGFEGNLYVSARSKSRPTVIDKDKTPLTLADGKPYGGCYVNAILDIWAQDNNFGKRVNASLSGIQFVADGESFGGARPARVDDFDVVEEESLV